MHKYVTSRTHILVTTLSFIYSHIHTHKKKCHLKLVECKSLNLERRREGEKQPFYMEIWTTFRSKLCVRLKD